MINNYNEKKIAILGLGVSGKASARFFINKFAKVTGFDNNIVKLNNDVDIQALKDQGLLITNGDHIDFMDFDLIIKSPGIGNDHPWIMQARNNGTKNVPIVGEIDIACAELSACGKKMAAITGSNGKTTTTVLVTHVLNASGMHAKALGNIGTPLINECLTQTTENCIYILELSSYQLETLNCPIFDVGAILNITPNHLDRYASFKAYAKAKLQMEQCVKPEGLFLIQDQAFFDFGHMLTKGKPVTYGYKLSASFFCNRQEVYQNGLLRFTVPDPYKGKYSHDIENIMAAYTICQCFGVNEKQFLDGLASFKKPPHRIELVTKFKGITFIDDSKATSVDAVIKAVHAMPEKVILIAGGVDKGGSYEPWIASFKNKVKKICAIGLAAQKIKNDLAHAIDVDILNSLDEAVVYAYSQAENGDTVLLSPGCSSFDMFKDYAHRGDEFKKIVFTLCNENKE